MNKMKKFIKVGVIMTCSLYANELQAMENDLTDPIKNQKVEKEMRMLTYDEINDMSLDVVHQLSIKFPEAKWEGILAITRGGLVPAGIFAQHLDIRRIEAINVKSYEDKSQGNLELLNNPDVPNGGANWLVIDDLSDTGKTLRFVREKYPLATYVVLMVKPLGMDAVDVYSAEFPQKVCLHFPWEPLDKK